MEKPSPHLSNESKALSQIVVLKRDVWEGYPSPPSEEEGECSLFMITPTKGPLNQGAPVWGLIVHSIAEARQDLGIMSTYFQ